ncbi:MAG TPA: host attachment protein [Burkholderiaceae bacterium]|nr:host attachment protein [Burkholderiaceae bacterium]
MKSTWVVVANASQARCYTREHASAPWTVVAEFQDPLGRAKGSDLVADRAGYEAVGRDRAGTAYAPRLDPKKKEHESFARQLAHFLNESVAARRCEQIVIFASNPFLGEIKPLLDEHASRALGRTLALDLTSFAGPELMRRIDEHLLPSS